MQYLSYPFQNNSDSTQFLFESIGHKGVIQKVILFTPFSDGDFFNLALVDVDPTTGLLDDQSVSDNGDTTTILATIFQVTHHFLQKNPHYTVYFEGNTPARNRLYRMAISKAIEELSEYFIMFGYCDQQWEMFRQNRPYVSFLIKYK